jgi:hypothetical protein
VSAKESPATDHGPHVTEFFSFLEMTYRGLDIAHHLRIADSSTLWLRLEDVSFISVPLRLFAKE